MPGSKGQKAVTTLQQEKDTDTMENKWELLESSNEDREKIWTKNRTFAGDVWFRFRHKPTAIAGLILL